MKFMAFLTALSFLLTGCASSPDKSERKALLHLQMGTAYLKQGAYPRALAELLAAEKLRPEHPLIQNNLGLAYFVRSKFQKAENHIRKAIEIDPKFTDAKNNLGRVLIERGLYTEAVEVLSEASEDLTYPEPQKIYVNLGIAQFRDGSYRPALNSLKEAIQLGSSRCATLNFYARSLYELEVYNKAQAAFDRAIASCKNKRFDEPYYFAALSYFKLGDKVLAKSRLNELLELHPDGEYYKKAKRLLALLKEHSK